MIKQTTSLRKIAALKKKIKVVRGGQGSGKTISILMLLINHASSQPNREILILSAELTKMRLTVIKDFVKVMRMFGIYNDSHFKASTLYRFPNGSFIKFIGLDKEDVGKGLRSDVAYFNEVNKCSPEAYRQVSSRAGQTYVDYNPDAVFFVDTDVIPRKDADFLQLTFIDNEELGEGERSEILNYHFLGYGVEYDPNDDTEHPIINKTYANLWQVYGLGNIGTLMGAVFDNWEVKELPQDARLICTGVDFGYATSEFAAVDIYKLNDHYFLDELVYETKLTNPEAAQKMVEGGYKNSTAYCDYAEPKSIRELSDNGIHAVPCESKNDIKAFAIKRLSEKTFYITPRSKNVKMEVENLIYDEKTNKVKKSDIDHATDAIFYAVGSEGKYDGRY